MNNTKYVSPKESAYCPECKMHPQQMRTRNHAERFCSSGHTFTLKQSREAEAKDAALAKSAHSSPTTETAFKNVRELVYQMAPNGEADSALMLAVNQLIAAVQGDGRAPTTEARERPEGWQWTHEHNAELIKRDGLMCEQHLGLEFDHNGCAGPGMAWVIEGRDAIAAALSSTPSENETLAAGLRQGYLCSKCKTWAESGHECAATPSDAAVREWQPIETAPKDGTYILFAREQPWSSSANVCVGFWADEQQTNNPHWQTENGFMVDTRIYRLWMPLPSPPAARTGEEK